jgi:hypothetical protein
VISELLEEAIERTGGKLTVQDMTYIQTSVLDVQARASLPDMLLLVDKATLRLSEF